jgi:hypothetical protein
MTKCLPQGETAYFVTPRSQSLGRPCVAVWTRRTTCADVVVKLAGDGCGWWSLLHDCYTVNVDELCRSAANEWGADRLTGPGG